MECFTCDYEGTRRGLGIHYGHEPDHRKPLSNKQKEVVTGLLMGDGSINRQSKSPRLRAEMTAKAYLEYLDSKFPHISCGVTQSRSASEQAESHRESGFNNSASGNNYSDCYWWETMTHQDFDEFADWYNTGNKVFPESLELTPTVLKNWYVCDGGVNNKSIRIYVGNERNNKSKIESYFLDIGIGSLKWSEVDRGSRSHTSINFSVEDSEKLFEYMGEPLPGFEYKWETETFK
jgi:hypothetical protein